MAGSSDGRDARGRRLAVAGTADFVPFSDDDARRSPAARFAAVARAHPDRTAMTDASGRLTYGELDSASDRIAAVIATTLGGRCEPVALMTEDGLAMAKAIFGTLKSGCFYVPMDPQYPDDRLAFMLDDCGARLILADASAAETAARFAGRARSVIRVDHAGSAGSGPVAAEPAPDSPAALIYTSGSTGTPKGAIQTHGAMMRFIMHYTNTFKPTAADRMALFASWGWVAAMVAFYVALLNGARVCRRDVKRLGVDGLAGWIRAQEVTSLSFSPTLLRQFETTLSETDFFPSVRWVGAGGEGLSAADFDIFRRRFRPDAFFVNAYGSTECGVIAQYLCAATMRLTRRRFPSATPSPASRSCSSTNRGERLPPARSAKSSSAPAGSPPATGNVPT